MKACDYYRERICLLSSGDLDKDDEAAVRKHMESCPGCTAYCEEMMSLCREIGALAGEGESVASLPGLHDRVREALTARRAPVLLRWRTLVPIAACLALIVGSVAYNQYRSRRFMESIVARVEKAGSGASIRRRGRLIAAAIGTPLVQGDRIETGDGQNVLFSYEGEETRVLVQQKTSLLLETSKEAKRLSLLRGQIEADVAPQPEDRPMVVVTPHAEMTVRGTRFEVRASDDITGLSVREGAVEMGLPGSGRCENVTGGMTALAKAGADRLVVPGKLVKTLNVKGLLPDTVLSGVAVAGNAVWVHGTRGRTGHSILACLDPVSGRVMRKMKLEERFKPGSCITWMEGLLWGFSRDGSSLEGIDVDTGETARTIPVPAEEISSTRMFDTCGGVAWLRGGTRKELVKVDLANGSVLARVRCPFAVDRIAASEHAVYAAEDGWNACKIDPNFARIDYRFMCGAESITGDMALDGRSRLWTVTETTLALHVLEAE
jgi:ferric-dicitrate binding protein FerR (iron transport regulator)